MMVTSDRAIREGAALRQQGTHQVPSGQPDAKGMGAESAEYAEPTIDPQWIDVWKMFLDRDGNEYGIPCKVPRGQWAVGGPNALVNQRRPDGGYWFSVDTPARVQPAPQFECFVGECRKKLHKRIMLVNHVRAFHADEAEAYKAVLMQIEQQVAKEDPRLQRLLASLDEPDAPIAEDTSVVLTCALCDKATPEGHADPEAWLRGHQLGAHKDGG